MTERTIRSAFAVIVAAQPDDLVSVALAHPTVWTAEQVTAAAAAAASTAPPAVRDPARPGGGGRGGGLLHDGPAGGRRRRAGVRRHRVLVRGHRCSRGRATGWCCSGTGPRPRASARADRAGTPSPADGDRLGDGPASGLWASDFAGAVGRALQHASLQGVAVVDVVVSGAAARERWLQQAAAEASGLDRVLALPSSAARGAAHMAVAAAPAPPHRLLRRPRRAPDRVRRGRPGPRGGRCPAGPAARSPGRRTASRRCAVAAPSRGAAPSAAGGPRRRGSCGRGGGRARRCRGHRRGRPVRSVVAHVAQRRSRSRPAGTSGGRGARTEPR